MSDIDTEQISNVDNNTYKCLYRDTDTGKIILTDYNNNEHRTDIFGRRLKSFLPNISGMLSGINRSNISIKMNASNSMNDIGENKNNLNSKKNKNLYHNYIPGIQKIDGYNFIPKPISIPFYNEDKSLLPDQVKNKLNHNLKRYYSEKNEKIQKNNNFRISYFNKDLNNNQMKEKDENRIITLINKSLEELKEENKIRLNSVEKNPQYIALNSFKKTIEDNNKKSIYLNFKETPIEIKDKYNILQNVIRNRINELKKKQNSVEKKEKEYLNKFIKNNKSKTLFDIQKKKYDLQNLIIGPDKLNNIFQSKDFSLGRTIKMDFGEKVKDDIKENNINQTEENKNEVTQNIKIDNILPKIEKRINSGNKSNVYQETDTAETNTYLNRNSSELVLGRNKSYKKMKLKISKRIILYL